MTLQWPAKKEGGSAKTPVSQRSPGARLSQVSSDPGCVESLDATTCTVTEAIGEPATLTASQKKPVTSVPENMRGVASVPAWATPVSTSAGTAVDHRQPVQTGSPAPPICWRRGVWSGDGPAPRKRPDKAFPRQRARKSPEYLSVRAG